MKTSHLIWSLSLAAAFGFGFYTRTLVAEEKPALNDYAKVTGIGGVFFKCNDPQAMRAWYETHLGLRTNDYGAVFEWYQGADNTQKGFSQWSPFSAKTTYFQPSTKDFMINYRVGDLDRLVLDLKTAGVTILDSVETYSYGKFVHILDPENNKIELWEPYDLEYEAMGKEMGAETTK